MSTTITDIATETVEDDTFDRTWLILKRDTDGRWLECGSAVTEYRYGLPNIQELGETHGAGEYMLLRASEKYDIQKLRVASSTVYDVVSEDES